HGIRLPARHGVIPNPVSDQPPTRSGDEALNPTILMCGRLAFMKGISRVGLILQRLCSACPEVRLEIAGADSYAWGIGSLEAWLRNDLQRAGVMSNVRFLGRLPEDKLDQAYRRAWVLMHPSLWESFGNVLPEAMIRQRPVVASRVGDIPDLLEGTGNISADPGTSDFSDALIRFLSDSQLRAVAGQQGREKVRQQYGPDVIAARYIRFLEGGGE
ncbi:MAG: glycosyltransferase family 4 protein, partial [Kiritimatiellia bacterium]|nr:glycosyltransferase family 4 protein [Kiritimatiellia bacterium]